MRRQMEPGRWRAAFSATSPSPPRAEATGGDQAVQRVADNAGAFRQGRAHGLGDQFEAGQIADSGQGVGGVGALNGALADHSDGFRAGQGKVEEAVRPAVLQ
ncbi:hypothetical protein ACFVVL_27605 [Kitasatospora sp. NPDC058115]|uniref:hypothetical protein n=1 Tax=Kitasatospora sp. NPDC058115 TaxID=3346347 RepID=UPI0036D7B8D1